MEQDVQDRRSIKILYFAGMNVPLRIGLILVCISSSTLLVAQTILVQPYLQDAEPDRMSILWET
ncbi:MAG TPA: hypothetical protein PK149_14295, partial [Flavobacteriales bacterium]|nr:hypothetical protein [Flavobacteriales bacterium]